MCFAPQRHAQFGQLDVKKWNEHVVLLPFWLGNVLCITTACTFSTSQLPKVVRTWRALYILTWNLEMCFAPQWRALFRHLNFQNWSEHVVFFYMFLPFWLGNVLGAKTACTFSTSQLPKVVWTWCALYILTWKCASHHHGAHFFDISTSKSGPNLACFVHFDLDLSFAPQRHALFRHLNFQKWSDVGVFCTFWLRDVLRAITACTFSSLIWPADSAPAALARLLFDPLEPQIIGQTQWIATFLPFRAPASSLFLTSPRFCFSIFAYCRKFDFQTSFDDKIGTLESLNALDMAKSCSVSRMGSRIIYHASLKP